MQVSILQLPYLWQTTKGHYTHDIVDMLEVQYDVLCNHHKL